VRGLVCVALLAGIAFCPRLWLSARTFPFAPPLGFIPAARQPFDVVLLGAFALALVIAAFFAHRAALAAALGLALLLAVQDQTRWQPWCYQYAAMLAVLLATRVREREPGTAHERDPASGGFGTLEPERALDACRAVIAGIYFWSGIQKLNAAFLDRGLVPVVGASVLSPQVHTLLVHAGRLVPFAEAAIGLALLWPRTRTKAAWAAVLMHTAILSIIGPFGRSWNSVVWPWNLAMIALVLVLFGGPVRSRPHDILALARPRSAVHAAVVAAFWLLPALGMLGLWDAYLSSALYSQNIRQGAAKISPAAAARMPEELQRRIDADSLIWFLDWSIEELNAPVYPERRVFESVARSLCTYAKAPDDLFLIVSSRPAVLTAERTTTSARCSDLQ